MSYSRKTYPKKTHTPKKKTARPHVIDGIYYKSEAFVKLHKEWENDPLITTFTLPQKGDGQKVSKYGALKVKVNGLVFDSVMEAKYYVYLLHEKKQGKIKDFKRQIKYELLPGFKYKYRTARVLAINYIADFVITALNDSETVIDVKGKKTPEFRIKQKLFFYENPDTEFLCIQWDPHEKAWRNLDDIEKDKRARSRKRKAAAK